VTRWNESDLKAIQARRHITPESNGLGNWPTRSKYGHRTAWRDGERFDSELEARCYDVLVLRQKAGAVLWFTRQVPFRLGGGVVYRADFLAVLADGGVEVIDAKGYDTQSSRNKRKQVRSRFGFDVLLWKD